MEGFRGFGGESHPQKLHIFNSPNLWEFGGGGKGSGFTYFKNI
jgi:hypothetical protein